MVVVVVMVMGGKERDSGGGNEVEGDVMEMVRVEWGLMILVW